MQTTMIPEQVKTQKIQARVQVSILEDKDVIFSIRSALEDFIMLYFLLVRNIYPKGSDFDLKAYLDSDYAGCNLDRKSTSRGCQILRAKLVCWSEKKQNSLAMSSAEVEYVVAVRCYAQVLWIKSQLADYDILYDKVPIFCDNTSVIAISNNPVLHSRTKHIDIREFWYFTEVDATKTITFTLTNFDKPISFNLDDFPSINGLNYSDNYVSIPTKETVRAGLATLGLINEKNPDLSSTTLVNSSLLKIKYFHRFGSLIWGLNVDTGNILFSDLVSKLHNGKKGRELNHISAISFKTPSASEVALTSHMLKLAKISTVPEQTLIFPSKEVNAGNITDKSLSETTESKSKKKVDETQHAEESVATIDAIKSLEASRSAEELRNQPKPADAEKEHEKIVEEAVDDPLAIDSRI
ncbi:hypothetical protein Tco_0065257 [Tanacetum coccineum]